MHLGSIYLIVKDFDKSVEFYEKLLEMPVTKMNKSRFAIFLFEGHCISLMNGYYDSLYPEDVIHKGGFDAYFDDLAGITNLPNSRKFVLNFWEDDLKKEYLRVKELNITNHLSKIKYVYNVSPYYYFQLTDPDGNVIEVTGNYTLDIEEKESWC